MSKLILPPSENKLFPFGPDPFQKGTSVQKRKQEVTKVVSHVKSFGKSTKYCIHSPKTEFDMGHSKGKSVFQHRFRVILHMCKV